MTRPDAPDPNLQPAAVEKTATLMTEEAIRRWRSEMESSLALWKEGGGYLVATEPDPAERDRIRGHLRVAIETLDRVLDDEKRTGRRVSVHG